MTQSPPAIPSHLIINADDFGLDPRMSRAISACLDEGLINSFSVFPFADAFHDSLLRDILVRHPAAKVGVHLSLIEPTAQAPADIGRGEFREHAEHYRDFLARYLTGRYPAARVKAEWSAQIEFVGGYVGGPRRLSHLDSHQHLHLLPGLWRAARSLQKEFGIPRLRVPYESLGRALFHRFPFGLGLQALARLRRRPGTPRFLGFLTSTCFTVEGNRAGLSEALRHPGTACELMVHPALPSDATEAESVKPAEAECPIAESRLAEIGELRRLRGLFQNKA